MNITELFRHPPNEYRPMPLWFLNHRLTNEELVRQIAELQSQGVGGLVLQARYGLLTPYLSQEWMDFIAIIICEGKKRGFKIWLGYADNGLGGSAGDRVIDRNPDFRRRILKLTDARAVIPGEAIEWPIKIEGRLLYLLGVSLAGEVHNLSSLYQDGVVKGSIPNEAVRLLAFCETLAESDSQRFYLDRLNAEAVKAFIETHYQNYVNILKDLASQIEGIYMDEPGLGGTDRQGIPWTASLPDYFRTRYGNEIHHCLPSLVIHHEEEGITQRCRFYQCVTELYNQSFWEPLHDFCRKNLWLLIAHPMTEGNLRKPIRVGGEYLSIAQYSDYPSCTTRSDATWPKPGIPNNFIAAKLASSSAHLLGKPKAVAETFGGAGWRLTEADWLQLGDFQIALGINFFIPHAAYYSIEGFRKWDSPPAFSYQQPYWPEYHRRLDQMSRLTAILSQGHHVAQALVLYPIRTFWGLFSLSSEEDAIVEHLQEELSLFCANLLRNRYDFDFITEEMLAELQIDDEKNFYFSAKEVNERYAVLMVPYSEVLLTQSLEMIEKLAAAGAFILFIEPLPRATAEHGADPTVQERIGRLIEKRENVYSVNNNLFTRLQERVKPIVKFQSTNRDILCLQRRSESEEIFFLVNTSPTKTYRENITFPVSSGSIYEADVETGDFYSVAECHSEPTLAFDFAPTESRLIVIAKNPYTEAKKLKVTLGEPDQRIFVKDEYFFFTQTGNYLPLNQWEMTTGPGNQKPVIGSGIQVRYTTRFWVRESCGPITLIIDGLQGQEFPGRRVDPCLEITLNGQPITQQVEREFLERHWVGYDISACLRRGENVLTISNPAHFHDSFALRDALVLQGDFQIQSIGDYEVITAPANTIRIGSWAAQGYPYFSGTGVYRQNINLPQDLTGSRIFLQFERVADQAEVLINNKTAGVLGKPPWRIEITPLAVPCGNLLELRVTNSLFNLFHRAPRESGLLGSVVIEVYTHVF